MEQHPQPNEETEAPAGSVLFSKQERLSWQTAIFSAHSKKAILSNVAADGTETYCYGYARIVCYSSSDGKNFDKRKYDDGQQRTLNKPIPFIKSEDLLSETKYELIYDNMDDKFINFTYKEYYRYAYNSEYVQTYAQKINFPIFTSPGTIDFREYLVGRLRFRDIPRIEVLDIHDNVVRYKVLPGSQTSSQRKPQQPEAGLPAQQPGQSQ